MNLFSNDFLLLLLLVMNARGFPAAAMAGPRVDYFRDLLYVRDETRVKLVLPDKGRDELVFEGIAARGQRVWTRPIKVGPAGQVVLMLRKAATERAARCRLVRRTSDKSETLFVFRIVRAFEGLPELKVGRFGFHDSGGTRCMIVAEHRSRAPDRTWAPLKAAANLFHEGPDIKKTIVVADLPLGKPVQGPADIAETLETGKAAAPILQAVARISRFRKFAPEGSVTLFLGSEDTAQGTGPALFRTAMEVILQHLESAGAQNVRLAWPVAAPPYRARLEAMRAQMDHLAVNSEFLISRNYFDTNS